MVLLPSDPMRTSRICGILCTIVYLALFFPSFYVLFLAPHLFENPHMTSAVGIFLTLLSISVPVSIVFSIIFMWYMYFQGSPTGVYVFCITPIITAIGAIILMSFTRGIFL